MIQHYQYNIRHHNGQTSWLEKLMHEENMVIIKTCWRLEIYRGSGWVPRETVQHLYQVVAGLDSPVLRDGAIQNQVKTAYQQASRQKKLDKFMHRLFQSALHTGKLVRTQTNIARGAVSYANAIYQIAAYQEQLPLSAPILIVGVNEITRNVCRFLIKKGYKHLTLLNRSLARAEALGKDMNIAFGSLSQLPDTLAQAEVLIAAAAAPESIIEAHNFSTKAYKIIDVGVPPNVDATIVNKPNITYYGIEAIERHINQSFSFRQKESAEAMRIIEAQVEGFMQWQEAELKRMERQVFKLLANG
ncbi:MAG: hypothetical protein ACP5PZ_00110 [Bacteroidales bacterium]